MEVGAKIRTLPCMPLGPRYCAEMVLLFVATLRSCETLRALRHVFHRKCIDRWLCEPGRKPRCPIDQVGRCLHAFWACMLRNPFPDDVLRLLPMRTWQAIPKSKFFGPLTDTSCSKL